jgi:hypothetical protein
MDFHNYPLSRRNFFKLIILTLLDPNPSLPILPFLCINQHTLFLEFEPHLHNLLEEIRQSKTRKRCKLSAVDGEVRRKAVAIWDESEIVAV